MRIIIADDHQIFLDGIRAILEMVSTFDIVAEVHDNTALLDCLKIKSADLIFHDYRMPGGGTLATINTIKNLYPRTKIIILSGTESGRLHKLFLQSKADGILLKDISGPELLTAVKDVMVGKRVMSPSIKEKIDAVGLDITNREFQIIELVAEGLNSNEIAKRLNRSHKTIENHRYSLMQKLNVKNTAELLKFVHENGLFES